jgi:hypothetical protein
MPSSDAWVRMPAVAWVAVSVLFAASCTASPAARQTQAAAVPACTPSAANPPSADSQAAVDAFRRAVEANPVFVTGATAGVDSCQMAVDAGVISLDYRFRGNGWLRAKHDPRIEYMDIETRFGIPLAQDPLPILTRAERAAFGDSGCGIDWKAGESHPVADDPGASEIIYRGDSCNCQARVRRDPAGRIVALILRSAC